MRTLFGKSAVPLLLCSLLFLAGTSLATNPVTVVVLDNGNGVEGVVVEVLASEGGYTFVTDLDGMVQADLSGQYFRLKVNGTAVEGSFSIADSPVTIELN